MPIYEYICSDCGKKFEAIRTMKDSDIQIGCKYCESSNTHRAISVCFAHGAGASMDNYSSSPVATGGGCGGCSGGSCGSCHH